MEVSKLQELCAEMLDLKAQALEFENKRKEINKQIMALEFEAIEHLEAHGLKRFDHGNGKIGTEAKRSVKLEDKYLFFEWLKERDRFDGLITVHSGKVNEIYKKELEVAKDNNDIEFLTNGIPGLSKPSTITKIKYYK